MRRLLTLDEQRDELTGDVANARRAYEHFQAEGPRHDETGIWDNPQCERGCAFCSTRCMVAKAILDHLERKLEAIGGQPDRAVLVHRGVIYAGAVGNA